MEAVTDGINKHVPTKKYIVDQVGAIENEFLKSLREASNCLGEEVRFAGFGEESRKIAQEIYDEGNAKCLKGKEAAWFFEQVEEYEESKPSMEGIQKLLGSYEKSLQTVLETANDIKRLLCSQLGSKVVGKEISSSLINSKIDPILFDSKILKMSRGHTEILSNIIN